MNDTTDLTALTVRMLVFAIIAGVFFLMLKSKKK
jgi:hypothetical protein